VSGKSVHKIVVQKERPEFFAQILYQLSFSLPDFIDQLSTAVNNCDNVFQIMTQPEVILAAAVKCFQFGSQELGGSHSADFHTQLVRF
jgi:hypothetical protein